MLYLNTLLLQRQLIVMAQMTSQVIAKLKNVHVNFIFKNASPSPMILNDLEASMKT